MTGFKKLLQKIFVTDILCNISFAERICHSYYGIFPNTTDCRGYVFADDRGIYNSHTQVSRRVETVCLLTKLSDVKHHVEVELNLDEMDLTSAESKATYEEIKAYVREHAGLNVSKLYIAQTKRKCGIIERENYNLPKSEDSRQPQCPPEKEKAIMDALRHFGMLKTEKESL